MRTARRLTVAGRTWRVVEAWRGSSGWGLAYFVALDAEDPSSDDRLDRRAVLEPEEDLAALDEADLAGRVEGGAGLTSTERRIVDDDGRPWLVQSRGPVWAEGEVAAGLTSLLFTALDGPAERVPAEGGHAGRTDPAVLRERLREALTPPADG